MEVDTILSALLPSIASALAAFFFSQVKLYKTKLSEKEEEQEKRTAALEGGVRALLRCRLILIYGYYTKLGYLPTSEINNIQEMFDEFVVLGGRKDELQYVVDALIKLPHFKQELHDIIDA